MILNNVLIYLVDGTPQHFMLKTSIDLLSNHVEYMHLELQIQTSVQSLFLWISGSDDINGPRGNIIHTYHLYPYYLSVVAKSNGKYQNFERVIKLCYYMLFASGNLTL